MSEQTCLTNFVMRAADKERLRNIAANPQNMRERMKPLYKLVRCVEIYRFRSPSH